MSPGDSTDGLTPWYGDEAFWDTFYDCLFNDESFGRAAAEVASLGELAGVKGGAVLDLGCGPGRHAVPFAAAGFRVTGVDLSTVLLERARQRGRKAGVDVEWVREDMRAFRREGVYDLAVSMWTSFGYFEDSAEDVAVLENVHASLKPGGALVMDLVGKEWLCRNLQPVHLRELDDGSLLVERPVLGDNLTRIRNEWLLIRGDRVYRREWTHRVYSGQELADRLFAAGFESVSLYGNLEGADYDLDAERLVAVAVRRANQ